MKLRAILALWVVIAAIAGLLGGCGGDSSDPTVRGAPWTLRADHRTGVPLSAGTRDISIRVEGGYCLGQTRPRFDHATVTEESTRVVVKTYLHEYPFHGKGCEGLGLLVPGTIHLDSPLGSRSIFDDAGTTRAGFGRPILRWPGDSDWDCLRTLPQFSNLPDTGGRPQVSSLLVYSLGSATLGNPSVTEQCDV